MISTILLNKDSNNKKVTVWLIRAVSLVFWIIVWHIIAVRVNTKILLPTPFQVLAKLRELIFTAEFGKAVLNSFTRILRGFFFALLTGTLLAIISAAIKYVKIIISPFMSAIKSVPVASFVILSLIWLDSAQLSEFIAFVMVLPIIYISVINGIGARDRKMLEMAKVFGFSPLKKLMYIYLPATIPFFKSGCSVALGLCWKAGVAAELIGAPDGTIGEQLYYSKIYILTEDLFAWTLVIIFISIVFEKLFMLTLNALVSLYERL